MEKGGRVVDIQNIYLGKWAFQSLNLSTLVSLPRHIILCNGKKKRGKVIKEEPQSRE
jgi:hypothetical protein